MEECVVYDIGDRLRTLRKKRMMSQEQVAYFLNIKPDTYRSIEKGRTNGRIETLVKLAKFFDVSLDYLIYGTSDTAEELARLLSDLNLEMKNQVYEITNAVIIVLRGPTK